METIKEQANMHIQTLNKRNKLEETTTTTKVYNQHIQITVPNVANAKSNIYENNNGEGQKYVSRIWTVAE